MKKLLFVLAITMIAASAHAQNWDLRYAVEQNKHLVGEMFHDMDASLCRSHLGDGSATELSYCCGIKTLPDGSINPEGNPNNAHLDPRACDEMLDRWDRRHALAARQAERRERAFEDNIDFRQRVADRELRRAEKREQRADRPLEQKPDQPQLGLIRNMTHWCLTINGHRVKAGEFAPEDLDPEQLSVIAPPNTCRTMIAQEDEKFPNQFNVVCEKTTER